MNQADLQALLIKRLDDIQDKIIGIGERLGLLEGKIVIIQEKVSSLEDKIEASENEGRVLRGKQHENETRFSDIAREISAIRNSMERQEGEIKKIKEEIKEMKEKVRPLMNLAHAISRFNRSATYVFLLVLITLAIYLIFLGDSGIIRPFMEILMKGG